MQETPVQFLGREDPLEKGQATHSSTLAWVTKSQTQLNNFYFHWGFTLAQTVNNVPATGETRVRSLGWKDPLEKGNGYAGFTQVVPGFI